MSAAYGQVTARSGSRAPADRSGASLDGARWLDVNEDPNSPEAVGWRASRLQAAWRTSGYGDGDPRVATLATYAAGRRVLDIGCVEHSASHVDPNNPDWLHGMVRRAARDCVGVDIHQPGVDEMKAAGLTAVCHDITDGPGPLAELEPFEVAIAGELMEHLSASQSFLEVVRDLLVPGGRLAVSTPNPYAPWRVRAGQTRRPYESADHVAYLFPSGVAELAERAGLVLVEAYTVFYPGFGQSVRRTAGALRRRLRGRKRKDPQLWPLGFDLPDTYVAPWTWLRLLPRRRHQWLGEHAIYVLQKPA